MPRTLVYQSVCQARWLKNAGNPPPTRCEAMAAMSSRGSVFICGGYSTAAVCAAPEAANGSTPMDLVPSCRRLMYQCAYMHDAFELDRVSLTWKQLRRPDSKPILSSGRSAGAACIHQDRLMVLGGFLGMMPDKTIPGDGNTVRWKCCQSCGVGQGKDGGQLLECEGCARAGSIVTWYCSSECQAKDWQVHKAWCGGSYRTPE
jgi:hypothetical protein